MNLPLLPVECSKDNMYSTAWKLPVHIRDDEHSAGTSQNNGKEKRCADEFVKSLFTADSIRSASKRCK